MPIVPSIGQDPDLAPLAGALDADGALLKVDARQATSLERVYAGGDVASMARFVTEAIGMGKRAAREIDRVLRARAGATAAAPMPARLATPSRSCRSRRSTRSTTRRRRARPSSGSTPRSASRATPRCSSASISSRRSPRPTRCFSCGTCIQCDNCVVYCPDLAVQARRRRLRGAGRLLQGLRHLREGVPDRLDEDGRGGAMNARRRDATPQRDSRRCC